MNNPEFPGDIKLIPRNIFHDNRGYFSEFYNELKLSDFNLPHFCQDNISNSRKGVIRGLHWQVPPFAQGKLVGCLRGAIFDVVVDIDTQSSNYGKHYQFELSEDTQHLLWIPPKYAHGFQSLEENTLVLYKVDNHWDKDSERSVNPLDEYLNIPWPLSHTFISEKDTEAPNFVDLSNNE